MPVVCALVAVAWLLVSIRGSGSTTTTSGGGGGTTAYNVFLGSVPVHEWTNEGGGTELEAVGKETVEPTNPSTTKFFKSASAAAKFICKLALPGALVTDLNEGAKVIALAVHLSCKAAAATKCFRFGTVSPAVNSEPTGAAAQGWFTVALSKAQAEEQTKATLEALELEVKKLLATNLSAYEVYVTLEVEKAAAGTTPPAWLTRLLPRPLRRAR